MNRSTTSASHPYAAAVRRAQDLLRSRVPAVAERLPEQGFEADAAIRSMLRHLGHPLASTAFVIEHRDPARGVSCVAYDGDVPGVVLHPLRWDYGTMAHEAAHIMHTHASGRAPYTASTDEDTHGPSFAEHYAAALRHVHPDAGDFFAEVYPRVLKTALLCVAPDTLATTSTREE